MPRRKLAPDVAARMRRLQGELLELQQDLIVAGMLDEAEGGDFDRDELGLDPEEDDECRG